MWTLNNKIPEINMIIILVEMKALVVIQFLNQYICRVYVLEIRRRLLAITLLSKYIINITKKNIKDTK